MNTQERPVFADLLRAFREQTGLTQEELAERAGLSVDAVGMLERGVRRRPQRHTIHALADALGLSPADREQFESAARQSRHRPPARTAMSLVDSTQDDPLFGRDDDIRVLIDLLASPEVRILTLTGPGGVGKTRLAREVMSRLDEQFPDGTTFVPLAPLREPSLVAATIAVALSVNERAGQTPLEALKDRIRTKQALLLLDNFEHLLDAAPVVAELLASCPRLTILVTSRAPLHLSLERQYPVAPLVLPEDSDETIDRDLRSAPAIALFVRRARAVAPQFTLTRENAASVAAICRRLDGLPLAIELGAAWIKTLPPQSLLSRLDRALPLLTTGPRDSPARHRTLRDAIAWSCELLPVDCQVLLRRISVFPDGCTLPAIEAVAGSTIATLGNLATLVDASLVLAPSLSQPSRTIDGPEPRYRMLETVREYANELLIAHGDDDETRRRHAGFYLALVEEAQRHLVGPSETLWLSRLEEEHGNVRAALRWVLDQRLFDESTRFAAVLWRFWVTRGHLNEGRDWLEAILALARTVPAVDGSAPNGGIEPLRLAMLLHVTANLARSVGDYDRAWTMYQECLAIRRERDDRLGIVGVLHNLGIVAYERGEYAQAVRYLDESIPIARDLDATYGLALGLAFRGDAIRALGEPEQAMRQYSESLELFERIGHSWGVALASMGLAEASRDLGEQAHAIRTYRESLALSRSLGDQRSVANCLERLATLEITASEHTDTLRDAVRFLGAASALRQRLNAPRPPIQQDSYRESIIAARQSLGTDAFTAIFAEGEAMTLDEALDSALQERQ